MLTYKWEIHSMSSKDIGDYSNVIYSAVFSKLGVNEDGLTGTFKSAIEFSIDAIDSTDSDFTPFESLTKDNIVSWIKNQFNEEMINECIYDEIRLIEENNRILSSSEFPWNNTAIQV